MKRSLIVLVLATVLLGAFAVPGVARPGEIQAAANGYLVEVSDPGESWIQGNLWHVRGFTARYRIEGTDAYADCSTGDNFTVINWTWNLANGNSHVVGTYEFSLDAYDGGYSGIFWTMTRPNPNAVAGPDFDPANPETWPCVAWDKAGGAGQGYGDLAGAQQRSTLQSDTCSALFSQEVTIFFPGG